LPATAKGLIHLIEYADLCLNESMRGFAPVTPYFFFVLTQKSKKLTEAKILSKRTLSQAF